MFSAEKVKGKKAKFQISNFRFGEEIATLRKERRGTGFWATEDTENTEIFIDGTTGPIPRLSSGHA